MSDQLADMQMKYERRIESLRKRLDEANEEIERLNIQKEFLASKLEESQTQFAPHGRADISFFIISAEEYAERTMKGPAK